MSEVARRLLPAGDRALLVELPDLDAALGFFDAVRAAELPGVVEAVPAARTVLVRYHPLLTDFAELAARLAALTVTRGGFVEGSEVTIGVHYDGEDLAEVAALLGVDERAVIAAHTSGHYRVAFGGFAPGFAYLSGGDPLLNVPRRQSPRTRIPAGAVALAGTFSAVYPRESPGGWQLIGRTAEAMWNLDREPPALLQPGDHVRFVEVGRHTGPAEPLPAHATVDTLGPSPALEILSLGAQALLQDEGRPGLAGLGVPASGALDRLALHQANRLVGNPSDAAVIEFAWGGTVRAVGDVVVAVSGERADVHRVHRDDRRTPVADPAAVLLRDGESLAFRTVRGSRCYLAIRGGFQVSTVLGSRSSDVLSGIGPAPLIAGIHLPTGSGAGLPAVGDAEPWPDRLSGDEVHLPVLLGPRDDWFVDEAIRVLFGQPWEVTEQSNRVGLRLRGDQPLDRRSRDELPSEGLVTGAVQVPASGQPVLFLADHPVTGGYPVIAVVHSSALDVAGQLAPGMTVRFAPA
ncbi:MAG: 5-oxoprolinase/urea amidolyase family protein [Micropruina sp.]|nr:5-oxoprolinase/urea amidolyase family protein [Micropruina sp.]